MSAAHRIEARRVYAQDEIRVAGRPFGDPLPVPGQLPVVAVVGVIRPKPCVASETSACAASRFLLGEQLRQALVGCRLAPRVVLAAFLPVPDRMLLGRAEDEPVVLRQEERARRVLAERRAQREDVPRHLGADSLQRLGSAVDAGQVLQGLHPCAADVEVPRIPRRTRQARHLGRVTDVVDALAEALPLKRVEDAVRDAVGEDHRLVVVRVVVVGPRWCA